jgi:hypothetical protein
LDENKTVVTMNARQFYILMATVIITQALGFGLLYSRLPSNSDDIEQLRDVLRNEVGELHDLRSMLNQQQGLTAISLPEPAALRGAITAALQQALANLPTGTAQMPNTAQAEPSYEQLQAQAEAWDHASIVIDTAIGAGVWTEQDNLALQQHAGQLPQTKRTELIQKFGQALQEKRIKLTGPPPLM